MNWKSTQAYAIIGGILVSGLMAFGVLVPDEGAATTAAIAQLAGGILGIFGVVAAVRARKNPPTTPTP